MSKVDDELTRRLRRAERPVQVDGLFEGLERRRARRETLRKIQAGMLALAVIAATTGGFVALRSAFEGGGRNLGEEPTPSPSRDPSPSLSPEPVGRDIGLGFDLCNLERLGGIDFLGSGTKGVAWTGVRLKESGRCPDTYLTYLVAADVEGDGSADIFSETVENCFACRPFDAADLDGDGDEEVVVLSSGSSTPSFMIYAIADREMGPVPVAEPGNPEAGYMPDRPLTFWTGGDEGFAGWVGCESFPEAPELVLTTSDHPIEADTKQVRVTRFALQEDGMFHVVGTDRFSMPVGEPVPRVSDAPACGVDWQIWA
jgi:hypothetical protein